MLVDVRPYRVLKIACGLVAQTCTVTPHINMNSTNEIAVQRRLVRLNSSAAANASCQTNATANNSATDRIMAWRTMLISNRNCL